MNRFSSFFLLILALSACNTSKLAYYSDQEVEWKNIQLPTDLALSQTVFLIGDAGEPNLEEMSPNFKLMQTQLQKVGEKSAAIFLGDNIYPAGLPTKDDPSRAISEQKIDAQLAILDNYEGQPFFVPGNHDWNRWSPKGLKAVKRQEKYIEAKLDNKKVMMPGGGCGDPIKVKLEGGVVILFIDSQWFLQDWDHEKKINKGCEIKTRIEFLDRFEELIRKNKNKNILVAMHHPLFSNGHHGGQFSAKEHIFPLTFINKNLYIPLPVLGSIAPLFRSARGNVQDIPHPKYQRLKEELLEIVKKNQNIVFAAGHEHSLQYFNEKKHHFIVSGSGTKNTFARKGRNAEFVHSAKGFSKLYYYEDGSVWTEFVKPAPNGNENGVICFRRQLKSGTSPAEKVDYQFSAEDLQQDSITHQATDIYEAGSFKRFLMGNQYRDAWGNPVKAPVLDLTKEFGGLTPLRKGGGQSTVSLRMAAANGKQYALRGINKQVEKVLPGFAQQTIAQDVFQDQISAVHPYGAFVIPPMAEAAGIYHTNPRLFYMPKQETLGDYNQDFGNELYLLEERPAGDRTDVATFGNSTEIMNFGDLLQNLYNHPKHRVDEEWVLKSRLFDVFVHDWDRHDDQWRWAKFKEKDHTVYRPIPRDRDQVFYTFKGLLPGLTALVGVRKFKTFRKDFHDIAGQSTNAKDFDRSFLTRLEWSSWEAAAKKLQESMTDEVLENAFEIWQDDLYELNAPDIIAKLKNRRAQIPDMAWRLYRFISKKVNVVGTNKRDRFEVTHKENGETEVVSYWISDKKGKVKEERYRRIFDPKVTKEIRLYGLDEKDEFVFNGGKGKIKVRVIGGLGKDVVANNGTKRSRTIVYDTKTKKEGMEGIRESKFKDLRSKDIEVNDYARIHYLYNNILPLVSFGSTFDDGFFLGGGFIATKHGFRKDPFASSQSLNASVSVTTGAFAFKYKGIFTNALKIADLALETELKNPDYINFFGAGNRTANNATDNRFNWVRMEHYDVKAFLQKRSLTGNNTFRIGPSLESYKVLNRAGRVTEFPADFGINSSVFDRKSYVGLAADYEIKTTNNSLIPTEGIVLNLASDYHYGIEGGNNQFARIGASFSSYLSFGKKVKATFGTRVGASSIFGDYSFYNKNTLGGNENLRGLRNERFSGQTVFYHNNDLRIFLGYWKNKVIPLGFGVLGGFDYGQVWDPIDKVSARYFHKSYTAGIYVTPFNIAALTFNYSFSEEDPLFSFGLGFFF